MLLNGYEVSFEWLNIMEITVMFLQHCDCIKDHWIVHIKMVKIVKKVKPKNNSLLWHTISCLILLLSSPVFFFFFFSLPSVKYRSLGEKKNDSTFLGSSSWLKNLIYMRQINRRKLNRSLIAFILGRDQGKLTNLPKWPKLSL